MTVKRINHFINSNKWGIIVNSCSQMVFNGTSPLKLGMISP